jgi:hypothetical protein
MESDVNKGGREEPSRLKKRSKNMPRKKDHPLPMLIGEIIDNLTMSH